LNFLKEFAAKEKFVIPTADLAQRENCPAYAEASAGKHRRGEATISEFRGGLSLSRPRSGRKPPNYFKNKPL